MSPRWNPGPLPVTWAADVDALAARWKATVIARARVSRKETIASRTNPWALADERRDALVEAERLRAEAALGVPVRAMVSDRQHDAVTTTAYVSASALVAFEHAAGFWTPPNTRPSGALYDPEEPDAAG